MSLKKLTIPAVIAVLLTIYLLGCDKAQTSSTTTTTLSTGSSGLIIDHTCTDLSQVPETWITQAKDQFKVTYGHTSHGSQIITGMNNLTDSLYAWTNDYNYYAYGGSYSPAPAETLSLWDYHPDGDLGNPDWTTWKTRTEDLLNGAYTHAHGRNVVMWSWCGQVSSATESNINTYLDLMSELEAAYPEITFVYMTGHLDGSGTGGNLHQRNEQIRQYCRNNNKVLFDFADIESYDPDGNYYLDRGADDGCNYSGGNWAAEWAAANPGSDLCADCSCAHSEPVNCNLKGRAFWWLLARLAGWSGS